MSQAPPPPQQPGGRPLEPGERAELERLRAEVKQLRAHDTPGAAAAQGVASRSGRAGRAGRVGRWTGAVALLVIAATLFAASVLAVFVRTQVLDTDRYVETVSPLVRDPAIQATIADRVTTAIVDQLDLAELTQRLADALVQRGAPDQLDALVEPAVSGVTAFIGTEVNKVVASQEFASIWDSANRMVHAQLDDLLTTGQSQFLTASGTEVSLNLGAVIDLVKQRLVGRGFSLASKIPAVSLSLPLFHSDALPGIRTFVSVLDTAAWLLPVLAGLALIAGVLLAPSWRRGLLIGSTMLAVAMLVLLAGLAGVRDYYLSHLPASINSPAAVAAFYDIETRFLVSTIKTLLVSFVIVALACWLAGPSRPALLIRRLVGAALSGLAGAINRTGVTLGPVPSWLRQHRRPLAVGVVLIALAILVFWGQPGIGGVVWVTVAALAVLGLVEVVARTQPRPPTPA